MKLVLENCTKFSLYVSQEISKYKDVIFLGQGLGEAVSGEGALKMKELTYLHCQCFNLANAANHFYSFAKSSHNRVPCVFVILEEYK
jgi:glutamine---fructose-6-phosphate transaminase (isomerizing)